MGDGLKRAIAAARATRRTPQQQAGETEAFDKAAREFGLTPRRGDWIQTFTGRQYWPLDPRADEVEIRDIAHALAMLCRYTGHCNRFYSVAEHSVHVSYVVEAAIAAGWVHPRRQATDFDRRLIILRALLHDAAEAYCNDIARPVKRSITGYKEVEAANEMVICAQFCLPYCDNESDALIKQADNAMLLAEQAVLMKPPPQPWASVEVPPAMLEAAHRRMEICPEKRPLRYKQVFLARFAELTV